MNKTEPREILTIGHSNHPLWRFLQLVETHQVTTVVDVRSVPYSRRHPAYNREALSQGLRTAGLDYLFLGKQLGARPNDPACYENGRVQYRRLAESKRFREGLDRCIIESQTRRLALLCSEREPLVCHRCLLVARELESRGVHVSHILANATLETHAAAMNRLLNELKLRQFGLFDDGQDLFAEAYARQEERVAFVRPGSDSDTGEDV